MSCREVWFLTLARYALAVVFPFAYIALPGATLQAQTGKAASTQARPASVARSNTRQQRALIRHNEAGAIASLRTLFSAEATYQSTTGNGNYGTIEELGEQKLIDYVLAEGHRFGYLFKVRREKYSAESQSSLEIVATPRTYGVTGRQSFYIDETGVIRGKDKQGAEASRLDDSLVIDP
jgi:hypothetical protein